jgi:hypothetical protein
MSEWKTSYGVTVQNWLSKCAMVVVDCNLIGMGRRSPADPCHTTVRTGPYRRFENGYVSISSNKVGNPSDLKYPFESPTDRALAYGQETRSIMVAG